MQNSSGTDARPVRGWRTQGAGCRTVLNGLHDTDSHVREHALRLAEPLESAPEVRARLEQLTDDSDLRVRYQLAFSLGSVRGEMPSRALVKLARRDGGDSWFRLAILSSVNGRAGEVFRDLAADKEFRASSHGRTLLLALAGLIGSANRADEIAALAHGLDALPVEEQALARDITRALIGSFHPGRDQLRVCPRSGRNLWPTCCRRGNDAPDVKPPPPNELRRSARSAGA